MNWGVACFQASYLFPLPIFVSIVSIPSISWESHHLCLYDKYPSLLIEDTLLFPFLPARPIANYREFWTLWFKHSRLYKYDNRQWLAWSARSCDVTQVKLAYSLFERRPPHRSARFADIIYCISWLKTKTNNFWGCASLRLWNRVKSRLLKWKSGGVRGVMLEKRGKNFSFFFLFFSTRK